MRITRDSLLQSARQYAAQHLRKYRRTVCIYLAGSLLNDEPLLGGSTDIDLFFVLDSEPQQEREVVQLTDGVHFDIAHLPQEAFRQPRELRTDPWIAPTLCRNPLCLHDTQHWFEFTQASVCAQFDRPDYVLQRGRALAEGSRQLWMQLRGEALRGEAERVTALVRALEKAANAIATLSRGPLTERRFLLHFPQAAAAIGRPGLASGLVDILMPQALTKDAWSSWLAGWEEAFLAAGKAPGAPARLHPVRLEYYRSAAGVLRDEHPAAAAWPILRTWTQAVQTLPDQPGLAEAWRTGLRAAGLDPANLAGEVQALDTYLDSVEETLDLWGQSMGL